MPDDDALMASFGDALNGLLPPRATGLDDLADRLRLVVTAAHDILHARSVGLLLLDADGQVRVAASSTPSAELFERRQAELGVGPGIDVLTTPHAIVVDDLCTDERWPALRETAVSEGIRGVLSAPVMIGGAVAGNLNVVRGTANGWTEHDLGAAGVYAELVGVLLSLASQAAAS